MRYPSGAGLPRATSSPETTVSNAPQSPTASRMASITGRAEAETSPEAEARLAEAQGDLRHPGKPAALGPDQRDQALALPPHQLVR